jgi:hypothetical protein
MKFTGKIALFIVEAIAIAAIVMWFVWKDPFKIFSSHQLVMVQTPLDIKNIRSIGQLVTAEYYGEVMATLPESKLSEDKSFYENSAAELYDTLVYSIYRTDSLIKVNKIHKPWWKKKNKFFSQYYQDLCGNLRSHIFYFPLMVYLDSIYEYKLKKMGDYKNDLAKYENPVIDQIYEKISNNKELEVIDFATFFRTYEKYVKHPPSKNERKKEILIMGRGWVKAGINFSNINQTNFRYLKDKGIIQFYRIQPEILYHDINPWLVPKKIHGFDFIKISGRATNPDDITSVKRECLEKLEQQATDSHIIEKAKENAEQNLKSFFSLLTGTDIKQVKFIVSKYDVYRDMFSGSELSKAQFLSFDTLCKNDLDTLDTSWYKTMNKQREELDSFYRQDIAIKKVRFSDSLLVPVSKYTALAIKLTNNQEIDSAEMSVINNIYKTEIRSNTFTKSDSFWYKKPQTRATSFYRLFSKLLLPNYPQNVDRELLEKLKEELKKKTP